jgi:hypothetical protein
MNSKLEKARSQAAIPNAWTHSHAICYTVKAWVINNQLILINNPWPEFQIK